MGVKSRASHFYIPTFSFAFSVIRSVHSAIIWRRCIRAQNIEVSWPIASTCPWFLLFHKLLVSWLIDLNPFLLAENVNTTLQNISFSEPLWLQGESCDNVMLVVCCSTPNPYLKQGLIQVGNKQSYVELRLNVNINVGGIIVKFILAQIIFSVTAFSCHFEEKVVCDVW